MTAAVALVVSITLIPAMLAIFGRLVFWPGYDKADRKDPFASPARVSLAASASSRPVALVIVLLSGGLLFVCATGLPGTKLAIRLISGLPADTQEARAADAAGTGFAPGITAPTVVVVEGSGIGEDTAELVRLERALGVQPGVAGVLGPREQQIPQAPTASSSPRRKRRALRGDPGPRSGSELLRSIEVRALEDALPDLLSRQRTGGREGRNHRRTRSHPTPCRRWSTAPCVWAPWCSSSTSSCLALFLRAFVAPLYLLAASVASVAATLGLTKYVFQDLLGHSDLTYYVPFAAGVLLVCLGSDYNVYVVGPHLQEAERMPLREAIAFAAPRASKAIGVAGIALAASFGMLAVVPIDGFRELAFMLAVGVLLESFVVRSALIPALISLFGSSSGWPGRSAPQSRRARQRVPRIQQWEAKAQPSSSKRPRSGRPCAGSTGSARTRPVKPG
jgi:RND superfamily putative drug exporter